MVNSGVIAKSEGGVLTVIFDRPEACGECHACNRGSESCAKHTLLIPGEGNPGDRIEVEIDDSHFVLASAVAYLIPLAGLILGLALGAFVSNAAFGAVRELFAAIAGLAGVALGYLVMRALNPRFERDRWQPRIVSIRPAEQE